MECKNDSKVYEMTKVAFVTGITGQDGSYLAEFLLHKGYEVHGLKRRSSSLNTSRVDHLYQDPSLPDRRFIMHYGDLSDLGSLIRVIQDIQPDEIYNLGAQSHVKVSFETPLYTGDVNGMGAHRVLEAVRILGLFEKTKVYQASSSELYGLVQSVPQNEDTPFYPRSPYAVSKLYAYWIVVNYREAFGAFACNGILFNHESPRRGETFVTRKITRGVARIWLGLQEQVVLGNLDARRDWGHARDYVRMQWLMLQQESPVDYVIATGRQCSVRDFVERCFAVLGVQISWQGDGLEEVAVVAKISRVLSDKCKLKLGQVVVSVSPRYFREAEVQTLLGDSCNAKKALGWEPECDLDGLVKDMVRTDLYEQMQTLQQLGPEEFTDMYNLIQEQEG